MARPADQQDLIAWADYLEAYARDWDATFTGTDFLTQEYWYLFTHSVLAAWRGEDFILAAAMNKMKSGNAATKRARIKRAEAKKLLVLHEQGKEGDARATVVRPTPLLEELMSGHLRRTLADARNAVK